MSSGPRSSLGDVHNALSHLIYAVKESLDGICCEVTVSYRETTYLAVNVEVRSRNKQRVIDQLSHGIFHGPYDYRFMVSYSTMKEEPDDWVVVTGYPKMYP